MKACFRISWLVLACLIFASSAQAMDSIKLEPEIETVKLYGNVMKFQDTGKLAIKANEFSKWSAENESIQAEKEIEHFKFGMNGSRRVKLVAKNIGPSRVRLRVGVNRSSSLEAHLDLVRIYDMIALRENPYTVFSNDLRSFVKDGYRTIKGGPGSLRKAYGEVRDSFGKLEDS